uniref:Alpha N-terminal protein methyltransferase 1 n=1 Tax=Prasinoderma coloniale TaxID=156133 RepID=A0A7R9TU30_9VIRI
MSTKRIEGYDTDGRSFRSPADLWRHDRKMKGGSREDGGWYDHGVKYWENIPATVDGVLGGFGHVSGIDVKESKEFAARDDVMGAWLRDAIAGKGRRLAALDCGAGVGRVTKECLSDLFHDVDLAEPVAKFVDQAKIELTGHKGRFGGAAREFFVTGLEAFTPAPQAYDVIWAQWVLPHLTDSDMIAFFKRCSPGLRPGGFFVVKENIARDHFVMDNEDSSVTRTDDYFRALFKRTGLELMASQQQKEFPDDLFKVMMYALRFPVSEAPGAGGDAPMEGAAPEGKPPPQQQQRPPQKKQRVRPALID